MHISLKRFHAFVFDFDGVIVDSLDIKTRAYGELFREHGEPVAQQAMNYHKNNGGVSRYEKFRYYYKHFLKQEITEAIVDDLDKKYSRVVMQQVIAAPYVEGAQEILEEIRCCGKDCFVISGTPEKEMREIIRNRGMQKYFKDVLGSPKNKVENLQTVIQQYSLSPRDMIFFGDSKSDYETARAHHVQFIAIVDKSTELENVMNITKIKNFTGVFSMDE
jgi:phosphoglycolate phosphatase-like HAD superfamily hydrolase